MAGLDLPQTRITLAEIVPAGPLAFRDPTPPFPPSIPAASLPAFCRVAGVVEPAISFEVWLPLAGWNGRLEAVGNHRFAGTIAYADMAPQLERGYATASTDTGHAGEEPLPWMQDKQRVVDYGYRAIHEMTVRAKAILRAFYGSDARYAYFNGCSTGGMQGLTEAQRYPEDYDGIIVGDPNNAQTRNRASYVWDAQVTFAHAETALPREKLPLLYRAAIASCDALDGVADGVIDDPRQCHADPAALLCRPGADPAACLTQGQVEAARQLYAGPRNPRTGEQVYPGLVPGSEMFWGPLVSGPKLFATADQFFKHMIFADPNWDYRGFDFDTDMALAEAKAAGITDAVDPDLRRFKDRGGKIIHYHGWSDTVHTPPYSIDYYERVAASLAPGETRAASFRRTGEFYRLFMRPGAAGCSPGGDGPDMFDPRPAIESWVERGIAPERIITARVTKGVADRTRPLCPYPRRAAWSGAGSTDDAENFACVEEAPQQ